MTASDSRNKTPPFPGIPTWVPLLAFITLIFLIGAAGYATFEQYKKSITEQEVQNLGAIADLKVAQIVAWREAHRRWAEFFLHGAMLPDEVDQWLHEGAPANERKQKILKVLAGIQQEQGYKTISLLDKEGTARISTNGRYAPDMEEKKLAVEAMRTQRVLFSDLHREGREGNKITIDSAAPLMVTDEKKAARTVGVLLFGIDPDSFLYPMIQSWPTKSPSAETLLVRRDGDDILILNEVRHKKGAALSLRIPLTNTQLPSAQAVLGLAKATEGVDYRGVPVVAAQRSIPGTPWFMVSKIDKAELFAPINTLERWVTGLVLVFAVGGGALVFLWFKGRQARYAHLKTQHDAAEDMWRQKRFIRQVIDTDPNLISVKDAEGKFLLVNQAMADAYGKMPQELIGQNIAELYPNKAEADRYLEADREVLATRHPVVLITPNSLGGKVRWFLTIKTPMVQPDGTVHVLGIAVDITERKLAEERLRESYQELEKLTTHLEVVREDEQKRIARELHDEMGGVLAALNVNVSLLAAQIPAEMTGLITEMDNLAKLVAAGIQALRRTVAELRPSLLDEVGLTFAIKRYVLEFERNTKIECDLRLPEEDLALDGNQSSVIFRIIQESLTNVAKHAKASRVSIVLSEWDTVLVLTIRDNGTGFDLNPRKAKSFGLLGIRERAAMVGGKAQITSAAGKGTTVRVSLPLIASRHEGGPAN